MDTANQTIAGLNTKITDLTQQLDTANKAASSKSAELTQSERDALQAKQDVSQTRAKAERIANANE
ncbi:MAG: hypothetical protein LIR22_02400 [Bacillota bacterium]|nr:hypothetical protein [Bacillota bacterium]